MQVKVENLYSYQGNQIKEITLSNDFISVSFINIGATITKFIDIKSKINIVLNYDDKKMYQTNPYYLGSITGRHAGRIKDGLITIKNIQYQLPKNFIGKHFLHGNFHLKYFKDSLGENYITFKTISEDFEEGFPGLINLEVTYQLKKDFLVIKYCAHSTKPTLLNFTNHTYFNLNGEYKSNILNQELTINASNYIALDNEMIPKKITEVVNTPFDFRIIKKIGKDINLNNNQLIIANGYDHPYIINKQENISYAATLKSKHSNLILDIFSDHNALVVYSGNYIDASIPFANHQACKHCGVALESQGIPNSFYFNNYKDSNLFGENIEYQKTTIWRLHY